jgi:predicted DNA-binding protein (UPF0251 family)
MADLNNLGEERKINEDILDISNKLVTSLKERFKLGAQIGENERLLFGVSKQLQQTSLSLTSSIEKRNNLSIKSKDLSKEILKLETNKEKSLELQKKTAATLRQDQSNFTKQALKAASDIKINQQKINEAYAEQDAIRAKLANATGAELAILKEDLSYNKSKVSELEKQGSRLEAHKAKQKDLAKVTSLTIKAQKEGIKATEEEIAKLNKELELRKKIEASLGLTGGLIDIISKIPGIGKFLKADEAKKDMEELAIKMQKAGKDVSSFGNKAKIAFTGLKTLGDGLIKSITAPETILLLFAQSVNKADQQATKLAKSFGVTKDQAFQLRENFVAYSKSVNDNFVNTDRLFKAQSELSEQLGIAVQYSNEELETFSRLTEIVGLTADEAAKITKFSAAAGLNNKAYVSSLRVASFYAQQTTRTHFSDKEILQDISRLSAGILTKFQNNPKAIAAAVVQAKALGTTLEQVDKVGESLLNFESSIENELKAELLTGKQINLEKARYAALTGDQVTLTQELANQVGSLADFQNMNVIAQKSLAEAFGLSRDEVADMLIKQEAINKYGDKAAELNKEQLEYMKEHNLSADEMLDKVNNQRSVQDKFNDAMLKLQDIVGNLVAGPFGALLDTLANILNVVGLIGKPFAYIGNIIDTLTGKTSGLGSVLKGILATAAAIGMIINPLGTLGALAAGGAAVALFQSAGATKFADGGVVTSPITNATVGEAGPEAIIPLNSPKANSMIGGMDLTPMINAINEVKTAVSALANRPINSVLTIDGRQIGTAVGSQMETGTAQNISTSYKVA